MTFATVRDRVLKRRTSPDWGAVEGVPDGKGAEGDGTGEGYARKDVSADGERATMAVGKVMSTALRLGTSYGITDLQDWESFQ
jgi:hypothetical protein